MTNLGCGDIYDWSTGLVFKNGRYFDPTLGIWLALASLVMGGGWFANGHRRRRRGEKEKQYVLSLLLLLLAMGLSGCGDTPTPPPGTATPEATRECPPTPTPSPPPPPVDDWDLKQKTVQISRVGGEIGPLPENSLGTVIDGGYAIITHNHFIPVKAEKVIISAHNSTEIITLPDDESIIKPSKINEETLRWELPERLEGRASAEIGDASALKEGDTVAIPYIVKVNRRRVQVLHTTIISIQNPGTPTAIMHNKEGVMKPGDSGGGLFHHGKLVGNTEWIVPSYHHGGVSIPAVGSALYLP